MSPALRRLLRGALHHDATARHASRQASRSTLSAPAGWPQLRDLRGSETAGLLRRPQALAGNVRWLRGRGAHVPVRTRTADTTV